MPHTPLYSAALRSTPQRSYAGRMCTLCKQANETCQLEHGGRTYDVDLGIADLIRAIWDNGIEIDGCCQADPSSVDLGISSVPMAFVGIPSNEDLLRFLRVAAGQGLAAQVASRLTSGGEGGGTELRLSNGWVVRWSNFHPGFTVEFAPEEIGSIVSKLRAEGE